MLSTQVLVPEQYPGLPPGEDPGGVANRTGSFFALDDRDSPLGRGRRPDGRPHVWRTRLLPDEVGEYAIAWPYHCRADQPCPQGNRWRVLTVYAGRSDDPAVRGELRKVAQQVINTVRPITNALPGGDPAYLGPALSLQGSTPTTGIVQTTGALPPPRPPRGHDRRLEVDEHRRLEDAFGHGHGDEQSAGALAEIAPLCSGGHDILHGWQGSLLASTLPRGSGPLSCERKHAVS